MERRLTILLILLDLSKPLDFNGIFASDSHVLVILRTLEFWGVGVRSKFGFWRSYFLTPPSESNNVIGVIS